jgi:hypothetical protein
MFAISFAEAMHGIRVRDQQVDCEKQTMTALIADGRSPISRCRTRD